MVTTTDSSSNHHSPTATASANRKNLPSPWAQIVRGSDTEPLSPLHQSPPSTSDSSPPVDNSDSNALDSLDADKGNNKKKPAWKRPSNGVAEVGAVNVMGALSWPPLSESTKPSSKSTPDSSDGSLSTHQGPVTSHSPQKHAASNAKTNPATNYGVPNRQKPMKRGGGNNNNIGHGPAHNNFTSPSAPPPPPPPFPVLPIPPSTFANGVPGIPDPSPRDPYRTNNWDARPPPVGGFVPPMIEHRGSSRRGNFGHHHPRGDGSYHNNYGGRRDQDRGNYTHTRDAHAHQQRMLPRGMMRPLPPNTASFMGPQPMRPFANPVGFPEYHYFPTLQFEPFGGMPFFTHGPPPAMFFPVAETPLTNMIANQIDYYFSDANLVKDEYLRSNMDEQGWVPITLIASFPRVKSLTSNIELILDSLRTSTVVEVQGDKLRRRNEWMKWLPSAHLRSDSGSESPGGSSYNNPAADFEKLTLDEATTDKVDSDPTTNVDATGESTTQSQLPNGDAARSSN